jgi:hypothetical protein
MTPPIDSLRGTPSVRRTRKTAAKRSEATAEATGANLPVPVDAPQTIPSGPANAGGETAIRAQVIGERRGLRAGPQVHDEARGAYNSVEWSGSRDRRRPKGGATKTKV